MKKRVFALCFGLWGVLMFPVFAGRIKPEAKKMYQLGLQNYNKGNYEEAIKNFSDALAKYPKYEAALLYRAYANEKLGNSFQALSDYEQLIKINPKHSQAYVSRGHLNSKIGLDDEAIKDYTAAIEHDNRNFEAHYERGMIYNILGLYNEALKDFEKCSQLKPGAEIDFMTGIVESKLGNEERAIHFFSAAIKFDKNNKNYYYHRADSKIKLGRYADALEDLIIANKLDEKDPYIYNKMGVANHFLRNYEKALFYFDKALEINPIVNEFNYNRARTHVALKNYEKAIADFSMVIELAPDNLDTYLYRASAYSALGKYEEAENDYSKYIEMNPGNFSVFQKRADVRISLKKYEQALEDLNKTIELKPENANAYHNRGIVEYNLNKKEEACRDFKKSGELGYKQDSLEIMNICK